jgi:processive 1,2-diacylglycerol beta-glucosyltransferase
MLLTAQYTGRGHMSIAEALSEQFHHMDGIELDVVDGFIFLGERGVKSSKIYNVVTQRARFVWKAVFKATQGGDFVPETMALLVQKRLDSYLREIKPDLILTVHPMFLGSVIDTLEKFGLDIPVVAVEADLANIHSTWCDPRVAKAICPTREAYDCSIALGMPVEKLEIIGFPTRAPFVEAARRMGERGYDASRPLNCLMTGGGGGAGDIEGYATSLLKDTDARLTIVCGSNEKLRARLVEKFGDKYAGRVRILGFVTDMAAEYEKADVAISRASPNCMFEAIVMAVPMVITGALPGQEKDNPNFAVRHKLGVICEEPEDMAERISDLTRDGGRLLNEIRRAQMSYRDLDSAKKIAEYVRDMLSAREPVATEVIYGG